MSKHFTVPASVVAVLGLPALENAIILADATDSVIAAHRDRQSRLIESSQAILARAEADGRDLTEAERNEVTGLTAEFKAIEEEIALRETVLQQNAALNAPRGRQTDNDEHVAAGGTGSGAGAVAAAARPAATQRATVPATVVRAGGTHGFRGFGEFANAVRQGSLRGGDLDPRLRNAAATTFGNESSGADGGFLVPPDFRQEILVRVFGEDSLISRTDRIQTSSNTLTLPTDETTPWQSTGGIQAFWTAEAAARGQSKPVLGETNLKLHTLATLVPVTEELLEDAPAMGSYLSRKAPQKMDFKLSDAIVRGTGVGQPLGFLASPALVTVAAEGGQTSGTINVDNVLKMWARMPAASLNTAIWLIHPDAMPQLPKMVIGQQPVFLPPTGVAGNMYGTLMGRPLIPHQVARTLGSLGDIMFVDLGQYLSATKTGGGYDASGIKTAESIHLWFDQDIRAFKFTMRVAGQPWWSSSIAQASGSNAQSPYVTLAAR